jgi:hypothetical protein
MIQIPRWIAVLVLMILAGALVAAFQALPRYQLRRDHLGRLIRLDAISGEVTLVQDTLRASMGELPSVEPARPAPRVRGRGRGATPARPDVTEPPQEARVESTITLCGFRGLPSTAATITDTPVFASPRSGESPLATLAPGVQLPIVDRTGEWLLIRLQGTAAHSAGYVHCSRVRDASPAAAIHHPSVHAGRT